MIYTGVNRLENWLIDSLDNQPAVTNFVRTTLVEELTAVPNSIVEMMVPELSASEEIYVSGDVNYRRAVGTAMVRAGVTILLVPDPIPVVDEVVGFGLVIGGSIIIALS
jgi:hypothetical protein